MITLLSRCFAVILLLATTLHAQVPQLINYQGRVAVDGVNFDGSGQFKFALVNAGGSTTYWSNDGSSAAGGEPGNAVTLAVSKGLYSVLLGDATLANMTIVPASVFVNGDVHLRVWFNDEVTGFQQLTPDRRIAAVGYAMMADGVVDGAITTAKIANGAVTSLKIVDGAITNAKISDGSISSGKLSAGAVGSAQLAPGAALANLNSAGQSGVATGGVLLSEEPNDSLVNAGYQNVGTMRVNTNTPNPGDGFTAIWTGEEMIIWGGSSAYPLGSRFYPNTGNWIPTSATNAPTKRNSHSVVWTGTEMIIWGGNNGSNSFGDGARYNPATNAWLSISPAGAPSPRYYHTAVWTGSEMIVWGGVAINGTNPTTGGRYNPYTDTWTPLSTSSAPTARSEHRAVWTGAEMIVWGGVIGGSNLTNTGGRYNPSTDSWQQVAAVGAPSARYLHCAIWTGSELIVWGGYSNVTSSYLDKGNRYNPATNTWVDLPDGPTGRGQFTAIWTGTKLIIWGGYGGSNLNTGSVFDPSLNTWAALPTANAPTGRYGHSAVWTGTDMIVWAGYNLLDGGSYKVATNAWQPLQSERTFYIYQKP
jgi:N-acetylneuraminic acid mutarotase